MELFEAIRGRRSVRKFKPDRIDKKIVAEVIKAALWAPSYLPPELVVCCLNRRRKREALFFPE